MLGSRGAAGRHGLVWFRDCDLRLRDQAALTAAHLECSSVSHVYCFEYLTSPRLTLPHLISPHLTSYRLTLPHLTAPNIASPYLTSHRLTSPHLTSHRLTSHVAPSPRSYRPSKETGLERVSFGRLRFIVESVNDVSRSLLARGSSLRVLIGAPEEQLMSVLGGSAAVYCSEEVTYEELRAQTRVASALPAGVRLSPYWSGTLVDRADLPIPLSRLDTFTSFRKAVESTSVIGALRSLSRDPRSRLRRQAVSGAGRLQARRLGRGRAAP